MICLYKRCTLLKQGFAFEHFEALEILGADIGFRILQYNYENQRNGAGVLQFAPENSEPRSIQNISDITISP